MPDPKKVQDEKDEKAKEDIPEKIARRVPPSRPSRGFFDAPPRRGESGGIRAPGRRGPNQGGYTPR